MDFKAIAAKVLTLIVPALKSKAAKTIGKDFSEAINNEILMLWEKRLKPIFIEEVEDETKEFEKDPENKDAQEDLAYELKKMLKKDEDLQKQVNQLIEKVENEKPGYIEKHNTMTISGNGVIGIQDSTNVHIHGSGNYNANKNEEKK